MSHYVTSFKSNTFRVKHPNAFEELCSLYGITKEDKCITRDDNAFMVYDYDFIPYRPLDEEQENTKIPDFIEMVGENLLEGEVAIFYEVGNTKLAEIYGRSIAINWKGETVSVDIENDIISKAKEIGYKKEFFTPAEKYRYINKARCCPLCESLYIDAKTVEHMDATLTEEVVCEKCGAEWIDYYELFNTDIVSKGEE